MNLSIDQAFGSEKHIRAQSCNIVGHHSIGFAKIFVIQRGEQMILQIFVLAVHAQSCVQDIGIKAARWGGYRILI